jgi:hypothetical protein
MRVKLLVPLFVAITATAYLVYAAYGLDARTSFCFAATTACAGAAVATAVGLS